MKSYTIFSTCEAERTAYAHPKSYEHSAVRLARSIRTNGGKYNNVKIKMWYGEDVPPSNNTIVKLKDLGCDLHQGRCLFSRYPLYNKVEACGMEFDTDYAVWMDSDIYVLDDLSDLLETDKDVLVSPDQKSIHRWSRTTENAKWQQIYKKLDVPEPKVKIECHIDGKPGNFYFCSGIFMFKTATSFSEVYQRCALNILSMSGPFTENFTQTGLGMAVHKGKYNYGLIPEKYHYFYALHDKKLAGDTRIVHYQDNRVTEIPDEEWNVI